MRDQTDQRRKLVELVEWVELEEVVEWDMLVGCHGSLDSLG